MIYDFQYDIIIKCEIYVMIYDFQYDMIMKYDIFKYTYFKYEILK